MLTSTVNQVSVVVSVRLGKLIVPVRTAWNEKVQLRVARTSAVLAQIKSLKMAGLVSIMSEGVHELRVQELELFKKYRFYRMWLTMLSNIHILLLWLFLYANISQTAVLVDIMSPILVVAGALFSQIWEGKLSPANTFSTLLVVTLITGPLMTVMKSYTDLSSTLACFRRIQEYLLLPEAVDGRSFIRVDRLLETKDSENGSDGKRSPREFLPSVDNSDLESKTGPPVLVLSDMSIGSHQTGRLLKSVSVSVFRSEFIVVLGPTGSGKSTLLQAILGEANVSAGSITIDEGRIAYCGQSPWIRNASIRDNIIGSTKECLDQEWYNSVIEACLLVQDMEQLPEGDLSPAGSNGANLSGGQKQRIVCKPVLLHIRFTC